MLKRHVKSAAVEYWFVPIAGDGHKTMVQTEWTSSIKGNAIWSNVTTRSSLKLDVALPVGFYHYGVNATFGSGKERGICQRQLYIAVLPGRDRIATDTMDDGITDPITPVLLAGTLPNRVAATLVRYDGTPECGAPIATLVGHHLLTSEVQGDAYYGYDMWLTAKPDNGGVVFGLELGWRDGQRRVLRVVADYPSNFISGSPTFTRFDITDEVAKFARSQPADSLVCPTK